MVWVIAVGVMNTTVVTVEALRVRVTRLVCAKGVNVSSGSVVVSTGSVTGYEVSKVVVKVDMVGIVVVWVETEISLTVVVTKIASDSVAVEVMESSIVVVLVTNKVSDSVVVDISTSATDVVVVAVIVCVSVEASGHEVAAGLTVLLPSKRLRAAPKENIESI